MNENKLREYAKLIVKIGANVQKGQRVRLQAEVDQIPLVKMVTEECYKAGASYVELFWSCGEVNKLHYQYATSDVLGEVAVWEEERAKQMTETLPVRIFIDSSDPDELSGISPDLISTVNQMRQKVLKKYRDQIDGKHQWLIVAAASEKWAKAVPPENSVANLTKSVKHYSFLSFYMLECIHDIIFEYKYKGGTIMVYIESPSTNPAFNLALEQYVFDRMDRSQEYFMLWQNDNTVVIGKNQNAFAEVNQKVADAKHISVVRRLSGGGAVYHDLGNLNFTFILNAKDATDLDIRLFCQPIAELLRSLNVPAEVNGRNDISIEGKKFSGNSQYLKQGRIMHHGTLMFHSDLSVVADVLNVSADKFQSKAAKSVKARVTNIAPYLPEGFTLAQFKALLLKYILKEENV